MGNHLSFDDFPLATLTSATHPSTHATAHPYTLSMPASFMGVANIKDGDGHQAYSVNYLIQLFHTTSTDMNFTLSDKYGHPVLHYQHHTLYVGDRCNEQQKFGVVKHTPFEYMATIEIFHSHRSFFLVWDWRTFKAVLCAGVPPSDIQARGHSQTLAHYERKSYVMPTWRATAAAGCDPVMVTIGLCIVHRLVESQRHHGAGNAGAMAAIAAAAPF